MTATPTPGDLSARPLGPAPKERDCTEEAAHYFHDQGWNAAIAALSAHDLTAPNRAYIAKAEAKLAALSALPVPPGYTTDKDGSIVPGSVYDGDERYDALPAAGGEYGISESIRLLMCVLEDDDRHGKLTPETVKEIRSHVYSSATTPQPSAAEGRPLVRFKHGDPLTGRIKPIPSSAVGAQGDGELASRLEVIADECEGAYDGWEDDRDDLILAAAIIRSSAAPAAGKGVDDAMVERALEAQAEYWGDEAKHVRCETCKGTGEDRAAGDWCGECGGQGMNFDGDESGAMRIALEAALTRQPVAGDGASRDRLWCEAIVRTQRWNAELGALACDVAEMLHYFNSHRPNKDSTQPVYPSRPAATPTDGGEGKS